MSNPLLERHRKSPDTETQSYGELDIVSTFGNPGLEYGAIYEGCGLMDAPHRGVLELAGKDRLPFLNNLLSNVTYDKNAKAGMPAGTGVYAFFLNLRGRIVADVNVLELPDEKPGGRTIVEADVRKIELLRSTWDRYLFVEKVTMTSRVGAVHALQLHGPRAAEVLRQATGARVALERPLAVAGVNVFGVEATVFRDDVCGVPGYHLLVPTASVEMVWTTLTERFGFGERGKGMLRPLGWAAFNAARVEAGRPLLDIDIPSAPPDRPGAKLNPAEADAAAGATPGTSGTASTATSAAPAVTAPSPGAGVLPAETGVAARAVSYTKCYVGQEIVARMHARGQVARLLVGVRMESDALPLAGATVVDAADNAIGAVTSSTVSPMLGGVAICLAYVKKPHFAPGTTVRIPAEGAMRTGTVVPTPFVTRGANE